MPVRKEKPLKRPAAPKSLAVGPDGYTLPERLQLAMAAKSRQLGREYQQKDLRQDANAAAGRSIGKPILTQQGLSRIMNGLVSESAAAPALAAALGVNALWLQYGTGPITMLEGLKKNRSA